MSDLPLDQNDLTSFGFTEIPRHQKAKKVQALFDRVADDYDLMNDLMSLGIHRAWKDQFTGWVRPFRGMDILDLAGGTGDIIKRLAPFVQDQGRLVVCDLSEGMVRAGKKRLGNDYQWVVGNGLHLPFPERSFDTVTMAFGLRNVSDISSCLQDIHRVLRPGGRFCCLEFSAVQWPVFDKIYDEYSFRLIPWIGEKVAKDRDAYQYLVESIRRFPQQEHLCELMREAGFGQVDFRNLSGGIAAMHRGFRIT